MEYARKRLSREERRVQILNIAMELFAEKGFENSTTKEISERAGVTEALIFRYYPNKDAMWQALYQRWIEEIRTPPTLEIINGSAMDTLRGIAERWIVNSPFSSQGTILSQAVNSRHGVRELVLNALQDAPDFSTSYILPVIIFGQQIGELRQGDAAAMTACFFSFVVGLSRLKETFSERYQNVQPLLEQELALLKK